MRRIMSEFPVPLLTPVSDPLAESCDALLPERTMALARLMESMKWNEASSSALRSTARNA